MVPFIGLTGGIAAGKSTALAALARRGAVVLSTDDVVYELYEAPEVREAVSARFEGAVAPDGRVDRAALADRAFATPQDRAWLEGLLWPLVGARMTEWRSQVELTSPRPRAAVVEVPLLFEAGLEGIFDATLVVLAEETLRRQRAGARGHRALERRSARQLSQQDKASRATYVVANDGTIAELESRLSAVLDMLET